MQVLPSFPKSVWSPSDRDLWRLWNYSQLTRRPPAIDSSDLEDAEFLLAALCVESMDLGAEFSMNECP